MPACPLPTAVGLLSSLRKENRIGVSCRNTTWEYAMIAYHPNSLLGHLAPAPDPRRRSGRRYPLPSLLGVVILGMLHGQDALHSAWTWAHGRWGARWRPLGAHSPHFPAYNTVRDLLACVDADDLDRRLRPWMERLLGMPVGGIRADGKVLGGSKRAGAPALHGVELVTHTTGMALAQREAVGGPVGAAHGSALGRAHGQYGCGLPECRRHPNHCAGTRQLPGRCQRRSG